MAWTFLGFKIEPTRIFRVVRAVVAGQDPTADPDEANALIVERVAGAARVVLGAVGLGGVWTPLVDASGVTVKQPDPTKLKCEPTQTDATKLAVTAKQATAGDLNMTEASAASTLAALKDAGGIAIGSLLRTLAGAAGSETTLAKIAAAIIAQNDPAGQAQTAGAELVDPSAWPADGVAGRVRRLIADLKGMLVVTLGRKLSGENGQVDAAGRLWTQLPGQYGVLLVASGQTVTIPCTLKGVLVSCTAAGQIQIRDGGVGGTVRWDPTFVLNEKREVPFFGGVTHGTDVYVTFVAPFAGSVCGIFDVP